MVMHRCSTGPARSNGRRRVGAFAVAIAFSVLIGGVPGIGGTGGLGVARAGDLVPADDPKAPEKEKDKEAPKKSVDPDGVVCGDARNWAKPAELDMDAVYREIAEYKEILEKKIEPSDAKYGVLMTKARTRFLDAVRAAAKDGGYDLVAKTGSVKGVENVPVITQDVIKKL